MAEWLERYRNAIVVVLAALLAAALVYIAVDRGNGPEPLEVRFGEATPGASGPMEVYITGAVSRPGVYEVEAGARVIDLLTLAGGFAPDADPEAVNLAKRLQDEDQVVVPSIGAPASSAVAGASVVDLNTATAAELDALPGIGEVYSQRIVDSRTADGPFADPEQLLARDLIPQSTYEKIRDLIVAGP